MLAWNHAFDYHQAILMDTTHRDFEIPLTKSFARDFFGRWTDDLRHTL
jgi:hypothetical protein